MPAIAVRSALHKHLGIVQLRTGDPRAGADAFVQRYSILEMSFGDIPARHRRREQAENRRRCTDAAAAVVHGNRQAIVRQ